MPLDLHGPPTSLLRIRRVRTSPRPRDDAPLEKRMVHGFSARGQVRPKWPVTMPKCSVTFGRNDRSHCAGMRDHDSEMTGHDGPKCPLGTTVHDPWAAPLKT
jgi:hypothetical protein